MPGMRAHIRSTSSYIYIIYKKQGVCAQVRAPAYGARRLYSPEGPVEGRRKWPVIAPADTKPHRYAY